MIPGSASDGDELVEESGEDDGRQTVLMYFMRTEISGGFHGGDWSLGRYVPSEAGTEGLVNRTRSFF